MPEDQETTDDQSASEPGQSDEQSSEGSVADESTQQATDDQGGDQQTTEDQSQDQQPADDQGGDQQTTEDQSQEQQPADDQGADQQTTDEEGQDQQTTDDQGPGQESTEDQSQNQSTTDDQGDQQTTEDQSQNRQTMDDQGASQQSTADRSQGQQSTGAQARSQSGAGVTKQSPADTRATQPQRPTTGGQRASPRELIPQDKSNACWLACSTMMRSWKDQASYTLSDTLKVLDASGGSFTQTYTANKGLSFADNQKIVQALGLTALPPASYTIDYFFSVLTESPIMAVIMFAPNSTIAHMVVIIDITGDRTPGGTYLSVNDPLPLKSGHTYKIPFTDFINKFESVVAYENKLGAKDLTSQLYYFKPTTTK